MGNRQEKIKNINSMGMINILKTERLSLQPLSENDSEFIIELLNTEGWIKYIGNRNIQSNADAIAYIQKINANKNIRYWTVKLKDTKSPIGLVTLIKRDYLEHNDIGFAFLPLFYAKGYAYEAANAVLNYLSKNKLATNILAETLPENMSSIKLLEKLGLRFEKEMEIENETLHIYGAPIVEV
jgi:[ribosomal protein S5]-alanine N-acetyltransferase